MAAQASLHPAWPPPRACARRAASASRRTGTSAAAIRRIRQRRPAVTDRDARAYISELDKAEVTQAIIHDPSQVAAIRSYVDDLRCKFPDVSDSDIGWMVQWVSSFILTAQRSEERR